MQHSLLLLGVLIQGETLLGTSPYPCRASASHLEGHVQT